MLLKEVKVIESATLPLKKYVIRPDVVPPGQVAIIISPTFNASGIGEKYDMVKAIKGRIIIWEVNPIIRDLGYRKRFLKFPGVSDNPTPSMISARIILSKMSPGVYA